MSLVSSESDGEHNEMRGLQEKLDGTITLVLLLSGQLSELKEQVDALGCKGSAEWEMRQKVPSQLVKTRTPPSTKCY